MTILKIGMIGLDTSHCLEFTRILNDPQHPFHVNGGYVYAAFPFFSEDLKISRSRMAGIRDVLKNEFSVIITESIQETAAMSDAILLTAVDGRTHLSLFKQLLPFKLPVFIDKPLAMSPAEADEIFALAQENGIPVMSSSSLRFAESFAAFLHQNRESITGAYFHGPLPQQDKMPGFYWYGIHMAEMAIAAYGTGVREILVRRHADYELALAQWEDGRMATFRGEYEWHSRFGVLFHTKEGAVSIEISKDSKPYYASLLEAVIPFFQTGQSPVAWEETREVIRLVDMLTAAGKSA
ncbi:Gfo/Idh/MocA family oxidoreductase [Bacillus infantis]|uniref:Gfo/Idh/MocA family oxidoreductase n=1 Tax=Bacillus infantis TaxID=324767 RepID=UPI0020043036|nr:Gfo/Idh/MocA family oxidoreductase [Bacillus infantis]MCK6207132.1 Gfo/Idh/MocA family oxidoreductase [Bacillus infantis]